MFTHAFFSCSRECSLETLCAKKEKWNDRAEKGKETQPYFWNWIFLKRPFRYPNIPCWRVHSTISWVNHFLETPIFTVHPIAIVSWFTEPSNPGGLRLISFIVSLSIVARACISRTRIHLFRILVESSNQSPRDSCKHWGAYAWSYPMRWRLCPEKASPRPQTPIAPPCHCYWTAGEQSKEHGWTVRLVLANDRNSLTQHIYAISIAIRR